MIDAWRLAVGTLTAIPVRPPQAVSSAVAGRAMLLAPVAVLPLAGLPLLGWGIVTASGMPLLAAALVLAGLALATRGVHLDGLADTCDGLSASYQPERALAVMRTGDVGPSGVAAVVLVLLVQLAGLAGLLASWTGAVVAAFAVASGRHTLAWACRRRVPAARLGGLGAAVAGTVAPPWATTTFVAIGAVGAGMLRLAGLPVGSAAFVAAVTLGGAVLAGWLVTRRACRRIGGVTGDVLGAGVELGVAAALTTGLMALHAVL